MIKNKVITLFIALMCVSPISCFFTVICRGSDGHVAVEPVIHNHCEHPETDNNFAGVAVDSSTDHGHCKDSIITSNVIIPARKNLKLSSDKVFTANIFLKSNTTHTSSISSLALRSYELSSFFAPLRTVILLA